MAKELIKADMLDDSIESIQSMIVPIRGVQVMLDRDLATLYGVDVKRLNEQVTRNIERFPERFMHQLTQEEFADLKSQFATSSCDSHLLHLKSQIATSSWGGVRKPPRVFTEQGISMLSAVLRSPTAIDVSIRIMDAFVAMRKLLSTVAPRWASLATQLEIVERRQISDQSRNEERFDQIFAKMGEGEVPLAQIFWSGASLKDAGRLTFAVAQMGGEVIPGLLASIRKAAK